MKRARLPCDEWIAGFAVALATQNKAAIADAIRAARLIVEGGERWCVAATAGIHGGRDS